MCGCHEQKACNHIDVGACSWYDYKNALCSHCADPEILFAVDRPKGKDVVYPELTKALLKKYFTIVGFPTGVSITTISKRHSGAGNWVIEKEHGRIAQFERFVEVLFPDAHRCSPGCYAVDPKNLITRI